MKRVKYLNNRDLLKEIHKSKGTYSSYVSDKDADYDIILPTLSKLNATTIAQARKNKAKKMTVTAWEEAKAQGQKKIKCPLAGIGRGAGRTILFSSVPLKVSEKIKWKLSDFGWGGNPQPDDQRLLPFFARVCARVCAEGMRRISIYLYIYMHILKTCFFWEVSAGYAPYIYIYLKMK